MSEPLGWAITREHDDTLVDVRISLGLKDGMGAYLLFRGDPEAVVTLLRQAAVVAEAALPRGDYADIRGKPQG